jgi:hypothetical protein
MMRNYISRLLIVTICTIVLSMLAYMLTIYSIKEYIPEVKANHQLFKGTNNNYNVLLLGTSRMKNGLDPLVIDSITGFSTYNAAVSGSSAIEANMILQAYLVNNPPPKTVFLTADVILISSKKNVTVPVAYITCTDVPKIRSTLVDGGMPLGLYDIVPFLKLSEMTDLYRMSCVRGLLRLFSKQTPTSKRNNGFINNYITTIKKDKPNAKKEMPVNVKCVKALDELISTCRQHNIKLVFVYAPEYKHYYTCNVTNLKEVMGVYEERAVKYGIPFLRYDSLDICFEGKYFKDNSHLNAKGAYLYSTIFANDILNKTAIYRP